MKSIFVLFVSILFASCVTPIQPTIIVKNDEFKNRTYISLFYNDLTDKMDYQRLAFNVYASIDGIDTAYFLDLVYRSDKWIFIDKELPATLIVDGNHIYIDKTDLIVEDVLYDGTIKETATVYIDKSLIKSLSQAKSIKIRINGKHYFDTDFKQKNIVALKDFCRRMKL